jgi:hypothetical protein
MSNEIMEFAEKFFRDGLKFEDGEIKVGIDLDNMKKVKRDEFQEEYVNIIDYLEGELKIFFIDYTKKLRAKGFFTAEEIAKGLIKEYGSRKWETVLDFLSDDEFDSVLIVLAKENQNEFIGLMEHKKFRASRIKLPTDILINMMTKELWAEERINNLKKLIKPDQKQEMENNLKSGVFSGIKSNVFRLSEERFAYSGFDNELCHLKTSFRVWNYLLTENDRKEISSIIVANLAKKLKPHMKKLKEHFDSDRFEIFEDLLELVESDNDDWQTIKATIALIKINKGDNQ